MNGSQLEQNITKLEKSEIPDDVLELHDLNPKDVLISFDRNLDKDQLKDILSKISSVAHVGIEVSDIDKTIIHLQEKYHERDYRLVKRFVSVGIPKQYEGSQCEIGLVIPKDINYPALELFAVNWQGQYCKMPQSERKKLIEHKALRVQNKGDVQRIINVLGVKTNKKIPPQSNEAAHEFFGYVINRKGEKIEIIANI